MGRHIFWYIIPKTLQHDTTKEICLDLEYQVDENELQELLCKKFHSESELDALSNGNYIEYLHKKKALADKYLLRRYGKEHDNVWCPVCKLYVNGFYENPLVIKYKSTSNSYSSPVVGSKWDIHSFNMGASYTDFARRFNHRSLIREISSSDVDEAFKRIETLGKPYCTYDREAAEETLYILNFLSRYKDDPTIRMIISDDF